MLNESDFLAGSWQQLALPGALMTTGATDVRLSTWVDEFPFTPAAVQVIAQVADTFLEQEPESPLPRLRQSNALMKALRQVYVDSEGEAMVLDAHPDLADPVKRPVGRPRMDGRPAGSVPQGGAPAVSPGFHYDVDTAVGLLRSSLDGAKVADAVERDMQAYVIRMAGTTGWFSDLDPESVTVRTWSPQELAVLLGVTSQTLTNWRANGYGPASIRTGARSDSVRYPVFRVVEWLTDASAPAEGSRLDVDA